MRFIIIVRQGRNRLAPITAQDRPTAEDIAFFWRAAGFKVRIFDRWAV